MVSLAAAVAAIMNDIDVSPAETQAERKKRYATFFPEKLAQVLASPYEDANSTWEFRATSVPSSRTPTPDNYSVEDLSPAQRIALKYRAGSPAQQIVMKYRQRELSIVINDVTARTSTDSSGHGTLVESDAPAKEEQMDEEHDDGSSIFEDASSSCSPDDDKETAFIELDAPILRHSISCSQLFDNAVRHDYSSFLFSKSSQGG